MHSKRKEGKARQAQEAAAVNTPLLWEKSSGLSSGVTTLASSVFSH
ncbi:MAG: hypothetical protein N2049_02065 [Anaerolineales bacterium]|nr:hypothetical protein [Anaerolineales bacterium]MDW8226671.1 hypothetical protein [Anaerolineales bacterium]